MTNAERMKAEMNRVRDHLGDAIHELEADEGDIRFFSAAILSAAIQLVVELEGTEGLNRAVTKIAMQEMTRTGEAGRC